MDWFGTPRQQPGTHRGGDDYDDDDDDDYDDDEEEIRMKPTTMTPCPPLKGGIDVCATRNRHTNAHYTNLHIPTHLHMPNNIYITDIGLYYL